MKRILLFDDYNHEIRDTEIIGTVRQTFGNPAFTNGWKIIEIQDSSESRRSRQGGVEHKGLCVHDSL